MTGNLVWLASYPKSGNTWMRSFLTAYLNGPGKEFDINDIDASLHAANRQLFDRVVGFPSADLLDREIDLLRADVYRAFDEESEGLLSLKTHDMWRRTFDGGELFPVASTRLVVLLVRNPLAVAPSYAHHYGLTIDEAIDRMADPDVCLARQASSMSAQLPQPLGTWSQHAVSWMAQGDLPVLLVRYEDLRTNPRNGFSRVLEACGVDVDARLLAQALERTEFARLQRAEEENGFRERRPKARRFFRQGAVDGWRQELSEEQIARIAMDHEQVMRRLGYVLESGGTAASTVPTLLP